MVKQRIIIRFIGLNYYLKTNGVCVSVSEEVCRAYSKMVGARVLHIMNESRIPSGCFHTRTISWFKTNNEWFNTASSNINCSSISKCVCEKGKFLLTFLSCEKVIHLL